MTRAPNAHPGIITATQLELKSGFWQLKQSSRVLERLLSQDREDVALSVITEAELRTGAATSSSPATTLRFVENFLRPLTIVEFTSADAIVYAQVRAKLERAGTPIGPLDTFIASQALARRVTLVSNNEREFRRVAGLSVVNWLR